MSNWSDLHWSMLSLIAEKLTDVSDHLKFSAVCSSWRSVALDIRPIFPCPPPGLMVRGEAGDYAYFISISDKRVCNQKLYIPREDWYIGTYGGWLISVHKNLDMSLYNPFSKETLLLPPATAVPKFGEYGGTPHNQIFVGSAALSSSNINVNPKELTVMIAQGGGRRLAFAKPGDSSWQIIDNDAYRCYNTITFYKGKFYAVGCHGSVQCDIGLNPKVTRIATRKNFCLRCYLVESQDGELILVERYHSKQRYKHLILRGHSDNKNNSNEKCDGKDCLQSEERRYVTTYFAAYKMDFVKGEWIRLKEGIGDQVFFLGFNAAFSLPSQPGQGNLVYFTDDYAEGLIVAMMEDGKLYASDMGVFNFIDESVCPHINVGAAGFFPPPMWAIHLPW